MDSNFPILVVKCGGIICLFFNSVGSCTQGLRSGSVSIACSVYAYE